jgi:hypothetical protein
VQPQAINGALKGAMPPPFDGTRGTVDLFLQTFNFLWPKTQHTMPWL